MIKFLLSFIITLNLSANIFDQMREKFVDQVEKITETSDLLITKEQDEVLKQREKRIKKNEANKEKELQRIRENANKMHTKIAEKELLKQEVQNGGHTYLGITMNMRTDVMQNSKYRGLHRTWIKRGNTNGVGVIILSEIMSEKNIMRYHRFIQSQYKYMDTKSFKVANRAINTYHYVNDGDSIVFSIETTEYKNPLLYKMTIKYTSREEIAYQNK